VLTPISRAAAPPARPTHPTCGCLTAGSWTARPPRRLLVWAGGLAATARVVLSPCGSAWDALGVTVLVAAAYAAIEAAGVLLLTVTAGLWLRMVRRAGHRPTPTAR
jgi:hypothetical protein